MFRKSILILFTCASMALAGQPASAKERDLGKLAAGSDKLVGLCNENNGKAWANPEGTNWGCGYEGGGGIICDKDTGCMEVTRTAPGPDKLWGLVGLLGLAGLLGLTRRNRDGRVEAAPDRSA